MSENRGVGARSVDAAANLMFLYGFVISLFDLVLFDFSHAVDRRLRISS